MVFFGASTPQRCRWRHEFCNIRDCSWYSAHRYIFLGTLLPIVEPAWNGCRLRLMGCWMLVGLSGRGSGQLLRGLDILVSPWVVFNSTCEALVLISLVKDTAD